MFYDRRCQIGTCHNPRRKVKPTRPMPVKWKLITDEQKQFLMHQMLIPEDILKCCPACHKKISKQLDMVKILNCDPVKRLLESHCILISLYFG